jgi:adenylate cyclase class 2
MCTEIEAKLKVDSLEPIAEKLARLGAEFLAEQLQRDYYFDDTEATLKGSDRALRIRQQRGGKDTSFSLAYKGAKEKSNFKKRREIEIEIKDADSATELLCALGYEKVLVIEKKRRLWRLGGCKVCLDELPLLGSFVEIEGDDDKEIVDAQKSLGLADLPHITESYAALVEKATSSA